MDPPHIKQISVALYRGQDPSMEEAGTYHYSSRDDKVLLYENTNLSYSIVIDRYERVKIIGCSGVVNLKVSYTAPCPGYTSLFVSNCPDLKTVTVNGIGYLHVKECKNLERADAGGSATIESWFDYCPMLTGTPAACGRLAVLECGSLTTADLSSVSIAEFRDCDSLVGVITAPSNPPKAMKFSKCGSLRTVPACKETTVVWDCASLSLISVSGLRELEVWKCPLLFALVGDSSELRSIRASFCASLNIRLHVMKSCKVYA
jgi:hypothetical protein